MQNLCCGLWMSFLVAARESPLELIFCILTDFLVKTRHFVYPLCHISDTIV